MNFKIVVLVSGNGSNLQAIIDNLHKKQQIEIVKVISNKKDAFALKRAEDSAISTQVIDHNAFSSRLEFDKELLISIENVNADLVVLAGFMRILTADFVKALEGKLINIHPSLLPLFKGTNTHQRVFDAREQMHGCSVHFVTEDLDGGPIIAQAAFHTQNASVHILEENVHILEHKLYPKVIELIATRQIKLIDNEVYFQEDKLDKPLKLEDIL